MLGRNATTLTRLLTSGEGIPEELRPVLEFVLLNAAALLVVAGRRLQGWSEVGEAGYCVGGVLEGVGDVP